MSNGDWCARMFKCNITLSGERELWSVLMWRLCFGFVAQRRVAQAVTQVNTDSRKTCALTLWNVRKIKHAVSSTKGMCHLFTTFNRNLKKIKKKMQTSLCNNNKKKIKILKKKHNLWSPLKFFLNPINYYQALSSFWPLLCIFHNLCNHNKKISHIFASHLIVWQWINF